MSRITLTKKSNGRYYLGMDAAAYGLLKDLMECSDAARAQKPSLWSAEERGVLEGLSATLKKPARGEA